MWRGMGRYKWVAGTCRSVHLFFVGIHEISLRGDRGCCGCSGSGRPVSLSVQWVAWAVETVQRIFGVQCCGPSGQGISCRASGAAWGLREKGRGGPSAAWRPWPDASYGSAAGSRGAAMPRAFSNGGCSRLEPPAACHIPGARSQKPDVLDPPQGLRMGGQRVLSGRGRRLLRRGRENRQLAHIPRVVLDDHGRLQVGGELLEAVQ